MPRQPLCHTQAIPKGGRVGTRLVTTVFIFPEQELVPASGHHGQQGSTALARLIGWRRPATDWTGSL